MKWADELQIETPEQIDVSLEIAGLGSRFVAQLLDWLIKWSLFLIAFLLIALLLALLNIDVAGKTLSVALAALGVVLFYFFLLGWDIYYELRRNGQTPGKRSAGIRVIREGGGPLDFRSASIRNLLGIADFLPVFYLLGGLLILLTKRGQRLGDLAAGTIVIRERVLDVPRDADVEIICLASEEFAFTAEHLNRCQPDDRNILRSFFQRYQELEAAPRLQLASRLAAQFVQKTSYQPLQPIAEGLRAQAFLASLYRDLQSQHRH